MLKGKGIFLRQVEETDANLLLLWENDVENWRFSETEAPYSRFEILEYIKNASQVRENKQLRFMICLNETQEAIGTLDLFSISFKHHRAGVGILIAKEENRGKGFARESLQLLEEYAVDQLGLTQLYCDILADNETSIQLFEKIGFEKTGTKRNWYNFKSGTIDTYFYQKFI